MNFQLSSGQGVYMMPPGKPSVRLAAFVSLRECCAGLYPDGTPFNEDGEEAERFKSLVEYEQLERELDVLRRVVETKFSTATETNGALAVLLFKQLTVVAHQRLILRAVNGNVVLAFDEYMRPDFDERILAVEERLVLLFRDVGTFVGTMAGSPV